jgi:hypothetical protein
MSGEQFLDASALWDHAAAGVLGGNYERRIGGFLFTVHHSSILLLFTPSQARRID